MTTMRRVVFVWTAAVIALAGTTGVAHAQYGARPMGSTSSAVGEDYHAEVSLGFWTPERDIQVASQSLGIIGTGPQAVAHVHAMRVVRPDIDSVVVAGRTPEHVSRVVHELVAAGENVTSGTYADAAACDIVCSATRSNAALFGRSDVRPGTHINLVGSYRPDLREVAADLVAASTVAVDDISAAKAEAGDLALAVDEGVWRWDRIAGDLTDLAAGRLRRTSDDEITLFKSVGLAVQDLAIAQRAASAAGIIEA